MEPRVSGAQADDFIRGSGFEFSYRVEANGFSGGIWVLWNSTVKLDFLAVSNQFMHGMCTDMANRNNFFISFVYASPSSAQRNYIWELLQALTPPPDCAWILGGDFNSICNSQERQGGSSRRSGICPRFCDFLFHSGLLDMGFNGPLFTWKRGDLSQRLDRCLCNSRWYEQFALSEIFHLSRLGSDHRPLLLSTEAPLLSHGSRPYRFLSIWNDHPEFSTLLENAWKNEDTILSNLLDFQDHTRVWNREVFGHIGRRKSHLLARIHGIERALESSNSPFLMELE
ncbi:hypothetical protein GQ457_01G050990 [Hibiscus cannabinus]